LHHTTSVHCKSSACTCVHTDKHTPTSPTLNKGHTVATFPVLWNSVTWTLHFHCLLQQSKHFLHVRSNCRYISDIRVISVRHNVILKDQPNYQPTLILLANMHIQSEFPKKSFCNLVFGLSAAVLHFMLKICSHFYPNFHQGSLMVNTVTYSHGWYFCNFII
jgi:hypothetical protein